MRRKFISLFLTISLLFQQTGFIYALGELDISSYLGKFSGAVIQDKFRPLHMRYFSYDTQSDDFKLLLDKGDEKELKEKELKEKTGKLLEYFKIGLTLPNDKFWVNLRPDAEDQIIDPDLEKTDIGKILLEADLQLKKDTAGATSPQTAEGKQYWDKLYKKAGELFGSENITIPTITRPWIVPGEVIINTSVNAAYIYKANLKVMLEEDYLSSRGGSRTAPTAYQQYEFNDPRLKELNQYSTRLIRELIIPRLTKEINTAKRYSALRQVFYSLVLAKWFKKAFVGKTGEYSSLIDTNNLTGLISPKSWSKLAYFNEYKKSFQDGEYNLKEPVYSPAGQTLRTYVSGGALPMDGNPIEINGNISLPTGKNIIPVSLSKGQAAASAIVDKQEVFDLAKKWLNKIFSIHPEGFGNMVLDEDGHYKGTPRYGTKELAVMKKEIDAFIKRQYGDSPDDFKEPVYVFAIGIGGQSACVFPAVKHTRRQPNRTLIECDSLGIDYSGYENELVEAIRKNRKTKALWEVGSKSGKTDETMTNFQQVFQMLIRVWSRVEYGDDNGRAIAQELIDKLFDGLPLAEKRLEQLNLKSEEQKVLSLVFDGLFMVTGKYDETQKKGSRLDQFRKGFLRQFYQGEDKVASLEMLDNLGGRYQMIGPNTAVLAALFGLKVEDIFAGGKEELLAQRSGNSESITLAETLYRENINHLLIAFPSGIIFSALGEGFDQNIAESTGKGRSIGEPVGLQPYVYTPDTIRDAFSNVKLTGKKAYFIIDVPGLPRTDIEKQIKKGDIVFRYQMNEISEKEFGRLVQFVEGITVRYGTLNTAQILSKKQREYKLTDIDLSDPEVMRQIMQGPDKTNLAKEGLQKLNDIWKQIDLFLQPDVEDAKKLLAEIARRFLNKEGKIVKGLLVRDNEARKDFYRNISKELNFSGGIIVNRGGLGLINQDGRYVSGDEAAESLNDLVSKIRVKESAPVRANITSVRLESIIKYTLYFLERLSSSNKNSGYPDTSLNNIQELEKRRTALFKDLHEQLSGKRLSAAQEDTAGALAALLLKAHKSGKTLNFTLYEVKNGVTEILRDFMRHLGIDCVDFGPGVQHKRFQAAAGGNGDNLAIEVIVQSVREPDYSNIKNEIIKADGNVHDYLHGLLPQEERWLYGQAYSQRFKDVKTETAELLASDLSDKTNMLNFIAVLIRMTSIYQHNVYYASSSLEFISLAYKAQENGLLSKAALENIRSWQGKEYESARQELAKEFEAAGNDSAKWKEINDGWYRQAAIGTAGMRGKMGLGTNRINKFTLGRLMAAQAKVVKGEAYARMLVEKGVFDPSAVKPAVAIGGDTRRGSYDPDAKGPGEFIKLDALINVIMGVKPYVFRRPTTTPQLSWTVANLEVDEGYQIISGSINTASHNPKTDNGKKPYKYDGSQITGKFVEFLNQELESQTIAELAELEYKGINILKNTDEAFELALKNEDIKYLGRPVDRDDFTGDAYNADEKFIARELQQGMYINSSNGAFDRREINLTNAKIVVSCLGGGAKPILSDLLKLRGVKEEQVFWVQSNPDPDFSEVEGGKPNPELESARSTALQKAIEIDADIVFWLDPDGDRPAVAAKKNSNKKAESTDDYLSLNGNQQLAVVTEYIIRELQRSAEENKVEDAPRFKDIDSDLRWNAEMLLKNKDKLRMAATVVSGDMMKVIARANGIKMIETLTGFKYIGDEIEKRSEYVRKLANIPYRDWQKLSYSEKLGHILRYGGEVILLGGEESLGLTTGLDMHDKDALSGILWLLEIFGRSRNQGVSLVQRLEGIYDTYGYYKEAFPMLQKGSQYSGVSFSEEDAMGIIKGEGESILGYFRNTPLKNIEIAGKKVIAMLDFQNQEAYNRDKKLIFDRTKRGLVTIGYSADDAGVYLNPLMADFGKIPLPEKMSGLSNKIDLRGIYSFGHLPLGEDKSGKYLLNMASKENNLPLEDFIMLVLEDGSKIIVRPSGTEPVIKFYINGRGLLENRVAVDGWIQEAYKGIDKLTNSIAKKRFPDRYSSSALTEVNSAARANDFKGGGIDMKGDNWIQVMGMNNIREFSDILPRNINREMDINKELIEINNLIQSGNIPSPERLGEDIGYCLYKDRLSAYKDDIDLSLMGVGRLKEEYGLEMGKEYLRILFLMHSIVNPFESESYLSED